MIRTAPLMLALANIEGAVFLSLTIPPNEGEMVLKAILDCKYPLV